ncbi:MAG: hypothetical protein QG632_835 [Candidatus Dependentiae bacterium]|nr:hypothetical protein [Candidatus Dependentiae bacterium]
MKLKVLMLAFCAVFGVLYFARSSDIASTIEPPFVAQTDVNLSLGTSLFSAKIAGSLSGTYSRRILEGLKVKTRPDDEGYLFGENAEDQICLVTFRDEDSPETILIDTYILRENAYYKLSTTNPIVLRPARETPSVNPTFSFSRFPLSDFTEAAIKKEADEVARAKTWMPTVVSCFNHCNPRCKLTTLKSFEKNFSTTDEYVVTMHLNDEFIIWTLDGEQSAHWLCHRGTYYPISMTLSLDGKMILCTPPEEYILNPGHTEVRIPLRLLNASFEREGIAK